MPAAAETDRDGTGMLAADEPDLLRFITCGSVDDGKSTLIGRLLYDAGQLPDDQLAALARDSARAGGAGAPLDLALALDGLTAEREQGITIDVAYRFFATARRSFIVADTPGHEQYTRNMATGASTADAAILLVDARKGLSRQTRRHSLIVATLGIRHVVVAVNKMDLVGWSEDAFAAIMREYGAFASGLFFATVAGIPISATLGDNVARRSAETPWYAGPDLVTVLETLDLGARAAEGPFRLPVQWVNRPDAEFRGFSGLVTGGPVRVGQAIVVQPSGETSRIARIVTHDGDLAVAPAGLSVTLTLADEVDASRGAVIAAADAPGRVADRLDVRVFWMARDPARAGSTVLVKIGAQVATATLAAIRFRLDLQDGAAGPAEALEANDLGDIVLALDRPVAFDDYASNPEAGSLILIDRESFETIGMGMVLPAASPAAPRDAEAGQASLPEIRHWLPAAFATPWRSALKTVTWRLAGTALTVAGISWLTGDLRTALLFGLLELVVKFALQFGHERVWTRIGFGLRLAPPSGRASLPAS